MMTASGYTIHTLSNGLRAVYRRHSGNVAYCGVAVDAGSRDEGRALGLAHFVEHTLFKGTSKRRAWHILNRMELVGGELNAYTSKEETLVYSLFPKGNMNRAMELIADLVQNSVFPEREVEKEREVVMEEIMSYRDSPSEAIYDDFEDLMFAGSGLGHNILGTEESLQGLGAADCQDFLHRMYTPGNMVLFGVGDTDPDRFFRMAERHFGAFQRFTARPMRIVPASAPKFAETRTIDSHQAHTIIGVPTFGMHDNRRHALLLLNNLLGGPGMNSLLNVAIRERHGYAYTVESAVTLMTDCGLMTIYFGCDERHAKRCLQLVDRTLDRLASTTMSGRQLDAAKKQYSGQMLVASASLEGTALSMGKSVMRFGSVTTVEELTESICSVTAEELRQAAAMIAQNHSRLTFL